MMSSPSLCLQKLLQGSSGTRHTASFRLLSLREFREEFLKGALGSIASLWVVAGRGRGGGEGEGKGRGAAAAARAGD